MPMPISWSTYFMKTRTFLHDNKIDAWSMRLYRVLSSIHYRIRTTNPIQSSSTALLI